MKVIFNSVSEFLEELRIEAKVPGAIIGNILRITNLYEGVKEIAPMQAVTVVAGAAVNGVLLELRLYCGDIWPGAPEWKSNGPTKQKARETTDWLRSEAVQLQLTVRKGMYGP